MKTISSVLLQRSGTRLPSLQMRLQFWLPLGVINRIQQLTAYNHPLCLTITRCHPPRSSRRSLTSSLTILALHRCGVLQHYLGQSVQGEALSTALVFQPWLQMRSSRLLKMYRETLASRSLWTFCPSRRDNWKIRRRKSGSMDSSPAQRDLRKLLSFRPNPIRGRGRGQP